MAQEKSIVGDLINFRGLVYAPLHENGVLFLCGRVANDLHMYIEEIKPGFPDCVARRFTGKGWERVRIEFEYQSSNFHQHKHDPKDCDIVVCWKHDWKDCPLEVIELQTEIQDMVNHPVKQPTATTDVDSDGEAALARLFETQHAAPDVQEWYRKLEEALREWNPEIWTKIGEKLIGVYSPQRAFAQAAPKATSLLVRCFSRGEPMAGTKVANAKHAPRWVYFTVKQESQVLEAVEILKESHARHRAAMKAGERTGYFSKDSRAAGEVAAAADDVSEE